MSLSASLKEPSVLYRTWIASSMRLCDSSRFQVAIASALPLNLERNEVGVFPRHRKLGRLLRVPHQRRFAGVKGVLDARVCAVLQNYGRHNLVYIICLIHIRKKK